MVTKKTVRNNVKRTSPIEMTRLEFYNWLDGANPGSSKKTYYPVYARDPKSRKWRPVYGNPWDIKVAYSAPKRVKLSASYVPPYDELSEWDKEGLRIKNHIYSEKDRQKYNRSMIAVPMTQSKHYNILKEAIKKLPNSPKPLGIYRKSGLYADAQLEYLMRERDRSNRRKHPLERRHK